MEHPSILYTGLWGTWSLPEKTQGTRPRTIAHNLEMSTSVIEGGNQRTWRKQQHGNSDNTGHTYNIIKTMYSKNKCAIKNGNKWTEFYGAWDRTEHPHQPSTTFNILYTLMNWQNDYNNHQLLTSHYMTVIYSSSPMQMAWSCCLHQRRLYSRTLTTWTCSFISGPWL